MMTMMNADQKLGLLQGATYGLFFQILGYLFKEYFEKKGPVYWGGYASIIMGLIIFAWGCSHVVNAKRLPKWATALGLVSVPGLLTLWFWPAQRGAGSTVSASGQNLRDDP